MPLISTSLLGVGGILLAHACYSAHEHSTLTAASTSSSTSAHAHAANGTSSSASTSISSATPSTSLPLDITLETLVSILLLISGIVLASPPLKPISWRVWAGAIEREGVRPGAAEPGKDRAAAGGDGARDGELSVNPFRALEERVGFWDVRAKRKEFSEWVKERDSVEKS